MLDALVEGQTLLVNRAYGSDAPRQSLTKRGVAAFSKGAGADHRVMLRYSTGFQLGKHRIELAHHMAANGTMSFDFGATRPRTSQSSPRPLPPPLKLYRFEKISATA
jgi:hypothetical protein